MPADRLITVSITGEGMRDQYGEFVPGTATTSRVWAGREDKALEDIEQEGGSRNVARRNYRLRWRSDLAATVPTNITITDDSQQTFQVSNIVEETEGHGRRRFMVLEVTAEVAA